MMATGSTILALLAMLAAPGAPLASQKRTARSVTVFSPDGRTRAELNAADGVLRYRIVVDGKQVLAPSMIGIQADDVELGHDVTLGSEKSRKVDEHYRLFGAHAEAVNRANEATISAQSHGQSYLVDVCMWLMMASACDCGFRPRRDEGCRSTWVLEGAHRLGE